MWRKRTLISCLMVVMILFSACNSLQEENGDQSFTIKISSACEEPIYAMRYEYLLDGKLLGGDDIVIETDGFKKGEAIVLEFTPEHFPEKADLSAVEVQIFIYTDDPKELKSFSASYAVEYGKEHEVVLYGESISEIEIL